MTGSGTGVFTRKQISQQGILGSSQFHKSAASLHRAYYSCTFHISHFLLLDTLAAALETLSPVSFSHVHHFICYIAGKPPRMTEARRANRGSSFVAMATLSLAGGASKYTPKSTEFTRIQAVKRVLQRKPRFLLFEHSSSKLV